MRVPLASPDINEDDKKAVMRVLDSNVLSIGENLTEFERNFASYIGTKHGIGVNSGTSGLHLIVRSLDLKEGDEVITTPFSFISSSNCLLFERVKPVFVDIDPFTYNIDPFRIEEKITPRTKAILGVHVFGHPYDVDAIHEIAKRHNLYVIEDACEALGAKYKGRVIGSESNASMFAFYPNKQMTTGEGGMIITNDDSINTLSRSMRNQGRGESNEWLSHERLGYNYRLDEMSAALGISQLSRVDDFIQKRNLIAQKYTDQLRHVRGVSTPYVSKNVDMSWFVYVIQFHPGIDRDTIMKKLNAMGVGCRAYFSPIHLQPLYREMFGYQMGDFPITESVGQHALAIPFFNQITDEQIEYVVKCIRDLV